MARAAAAHADLLIAEAHYRDKNIPYHLRLADLNAHLDQLTARRVILTHMSADMLDAPQEPSFEQGDRSGGCAVVKAVPGLGVGALTEREDLHRCDAEDEPLAAIGIAEHLAGDLEIPVEL